MFQPPHRGQFSHNVSTFRDIFAPKSKRMDTYSCTDDGILGAFCILIFHTIIYLRDISTAAHKCLANPVLLRSCLESPCIGASFPFSSPNNTSFFPESLKVQRNKSKTVPLPVPGKRSLSSFSLFLAISFSLSFCLSLTQLRVLGGNPASYPEAHPLPHGLGLPSQPGRLHAAEASWPSPPAPAESQRHVMPSGYSPARFPPLP